MKTTIAIILSAAIFLTACYKETENTPTQASTSKAAQAEQHGEHDQAHVDLPFNQNIIVYYHEKQNDELEACRGSKIKLQSDNPNADCYDQLNAAFIAPRILYQNAHVALLSTRNMFGMGSEKQYSAELIYLSKETTAPIWGTLGSDFKVSQTSANTLDIHYTTSEYSQTVEKNETVQY